MQKISYVIPCYRSQHTVGGVVAEIAATMQTLPQYDYEVILVNDCSPDDTFGTIRSLVAADSHVVGVDLAKNFGQHAALMAGFHKCSGDIVVCLDDDGQTPADEVGKLLAKIDEGYDVVYASYDTKRQAGWRNLGSWVNSKMTEIMLGKPPELVVNSYLRRAAALWTCCCAMSTATPTSSGWCCAPPSASAMCRCTTAPVRRAAAATR